MAATALPVYLLRQIPSAVIPIIISGTDASTTVYAGVAGTQIDVWGFDLYPHGITDLDLLSGSTDITGLMPNDTATAGRFYCPCPSGDLRLDKAVPRCTTADGANLVLTNSGSGVRVTGTIWITQRPTNS